MSETNAVTRLAMVMATIRQRIAGRSLTPGAKLPSVRGLAATLKVSTSTVVEAYERLVAEGAIHSQARLRLLRRQPDRAAVAVRCRPQARPRRRSLLGVAAIARSE